MGAEDTSFEGSGAEVSRFEGSGAEGSGFEGSGADGSGFEGSGAEDASFEGSGIKDQVHMEGSGAAATTFAFSSVFILLLCTAALSLCWRLLPRFQSAGA